MALFVLVVAIAFAAMALVPPSGAAFALLGSPAISAPSLISEPPAGSGHELSEAGIACHGQAWGAESAQCLAVIGREHGDTRAVRIVYGA